MRIVHLYIRNTWRTDASNGPARVRPGLERASGEVEVGGRAEDTFTDAPHSTISILVIPLYGLGMPSTSKPKMHVHSYGMCVCVFVCVVTGNGGGALKHRRTLASDEKASQATVCHLRVKSYLVVIPETHAPDPGTVPAAPWVLGWPSRTRSARAAKVLRCLTRQTLA